MTRVLEARIIACPGSENVRSVAFGVNGFLIVTHEIEAVAEVRPVIVHHVAEKTFEEIEAALGRSVGRADAEMPFADDGGVAASLFEELRKERGIA
jgi:hypothetical protein